MALSPPSTAKPRIKENRQQVEVSYVREQLTETVAIDLIQIPGGEFLMGSPKDEPERFDDEGPQHLVRISSFWMGQYPVTQAEWEIVAAFPQVNRPLNPNPSRFKGDRLPVETVTWYDAVEFCDRLSQQTSRYYRLPTEAEWEYACRSVISYQLSVKNQAKIPLRQQGRSLNPKSKIPNILPFTGYQLKAGQEK